jgi:hypothetical protein
MRETVVIIILCLFGASLVIAGSGVFVTDAGTDDAGHANGLWANDGVALQFGQYGGVACVVGFRLVNITIPPGSIIDSAFIVVKSGGTFDSARSENTTNIRVYCELIADAPTFSDSADMVNRTRTDANTVVNVWEDWSSDLWYRLGDGSQNFNDEVQEVIDLSGWTSGNDIVFLIMNNAGGWGSHRVIYTYEHEEGPFYDSLYVWWSDAPSEGAADTQKVLIPGGD